MSNLDLRDSSNATSATLDPRGTKTLVSVVVPCYNVAETLDDAVQSVLAQSYKHFELLLIDDGSTDGLTPALCDRYAEHPQIRVIHQDNTGLAGARNTGLNAATGELIALLDADDLYAPMKLEKHVEHFQNNPTLGLSFSYSRFIREDGRPLPLIQGGRLSRIDPATILCRNPIGNGSAAVLRRSALDDVSLPATRTKTKGLTPYFDNDLRQSEDVEFWLRLSRTTDWRLEGIAEPLTLYRLSSGGLSANTREQLSTWEVFLTKAQGYAPELVANYGSLARAFQLRYLCRRALQGQNTNEAVSYLAAAWREDRNILWQEPTRTLATAAACAAAWLLNKMRGSQRLDRTCS